MLVRGHLQLPLVSSHLALVEQISFIGRVCSLGDRIPSCKECAREVDREHVPAERCEGSCKQNRLHSCPCGVCALPCDIWNNRQLAWEAGFQKRDVTCFVVRSRGGTAILEV